MSHLTVYDGRMTEFVESDKSPVGRLALTAGKLPPKRHLETGSFAAVNRLLSGPCPKVVPCNFGPLIENWEDLSAVRMNKRVSSASTLPTDNRNKSLLQKPRLIELATYPGYIEHEPTPLPFNLQAADILNDVIDAQSDLKKKPSFTEYCRNNFMDVKIHKILLDLFWWLFLDVYNQNKIIQQNIFIRTANTFGDFFSLLGNENRFKDRFLQIQQDILSQAVFTIFIRAYPTSLKQFDDKFKSKICDLIYFWFSGLPPFPNSWKKWPIDKLVQDNILQRISSDVNTSYNENKLNLVSSKPSQEQDTPRDKTKHRKFILSQKPESHPIHGPSYILQRTLLRTTGHSPLMDYYLSSRQMVPPSAHAMLLSHSHALAPQNTTSITYFDFLKRYNKRAHNTRNKMYEIMRSTDDKILKRRLEQEKQLKVLANLAKQIPENRDELKFLRQRLVMHIMSDQFRESTGTHKEDETFLSGQQTASQPEP